MPRIRASSTMARPSGCSLDCSAAAANWSNRRPSNSGIGSGSMVVSRGTPQVSVPVLSSATMLVAASCSTTTADLTSTPCRPALAIADSSGGMVASTTAHGDATIMNVMARSNTGCSWAPRASGMAMSATVATTTPTE